MLGIESASCQSINTCEYFYHLNITNNFYTIVSINILKPNMEVDGSVGFVLSTKKPAVFASDFPQGLPESAPKQLSDPLSDALRKGWIPCDNNI